MPAPRLRDRNRGSDADANMEPRDLRLRAMVETALDPRTRDAASMDSGRLVRRVPGAVCRPADPATAASVMAWANQTRTPVTAHGLGHSQSGQGLADGGVLLDLTRMNRVGTCSERTVDVEAGATWRDVVEKTLPAGRAPRVLTNNLDTTVGGTLSTGGVGPASHRCGTQADNVEQLDVVTGSGVAARCSRDENPVLFDAVRCGLGQFAVITGARLVLRPVRSFVRTERLVYHDLAGLMAALDALVSDGACHYVRAWARHRSHRSAFGDLDFREGSDWCFPIHASVEYDRGGEAPGPLAGLKPDARFPPLEQPIAAFADQPEAGPGEPQPNSMVVCPVTEAYVPWERAADAVEAVLSSLPPTLVRTTNVMIRPLNRMGGGGPPLLMTPRDARIVGVGLVPYIAREDRGELLPAVEEAGSTMVAHGGRRYLTGWLSWDREAWRRHYGRRWRDVCDWKQRFDPAGVLGSKIIPFEEPQVG